MKNLRKPWELAHYESFFCNKSKPKANTQKPFVHAEIANCTDALLLKAKYPWHPQNTRAVLPLTPPQFTWLAFSFSRFPNRSEHGIPCPLCHFTTATHRPRSESLSRALSAGAALLAPSRFGSWIISNQSKAFCPSNTSSCVSVIRQRPTHVG